jgi:hypothetical protein
MTTAEAGHGGRLWQAAQDLLAVLGPVTVITGLFYYFGRASTESFYDYFGVSVSVLNLPTATYLTGTADTVFRPLATVLLLAVAALLLNLLLRHRIRAQPHLWRRRVTAGLFVTSVLLTCVSLLGLYASFPAVVAALALVAAVLLFEYGVWTAPPDDSRVATIQASAALLRYGLMTAVVLVAVFWAVTVTAHQRGERRARLVEGALLSLPQAVVYSEKNLQLSGPYVQATPLTGPHTAYRFRYNGLRPLVYANGRWFLLPAGWHHDNGATVIVIQDDPDSVRVDLAPGHGPAG